MRRYYPLRGRRGRYFKKEGLHLIIVDVADVVVVALTIRQDRSSW
jgi:uncharacterized membrane protein